MSRCIRQRGFTLIEMLVYTAVLVLVATAALAMLLSLSGLFKSYKAEQLVFRSATTALERFLYDARVSDSVTALGSPVPTTITFTNDTQTVSYAPVGGQLIVSENGTAIGPVTGDDVTVDAVYFYAYASTTAFARMALTLSATVGDTTVTRTFSTGTVLRASYE